MLQKVLGEAVLHALPARVQAVGSQLHLCEQSTHKEAEDMVRCT